MYEKLTTISLTRELVERLKALGRKGDRYEDIIRRLLEPVSKDSEETRRK